MNLNKSTSEHKEKPCNIIAVDVGTTLLTCHLFDKSGISKYNTTRKIELLHPKPGWVEMEPYHLWEQFQDIIWETMEAEQISPEDVTALGISTQRGTFVTWDRKTGKPQHNFITWQDLRASDHVENWNKSLAIKSLHAGSKFMHMISRRKQFLAGSVLNFSTQQVIMRLHYFLKNNPELQRKAENGSLFFGTIDTWLLWKLTRNKYHITDYSNASSTGMFDPFVMEWSSIITTVLNIPASILPKIVDTSGTICDTAKDIFGAPIPVRAVVADQQSAMFGQCCFDVGDVKCTMGTGTFICVNTGKYPHASVAGLYPLVAWKIGSELVYMAEGNASGTATAIEWSKSMGFFDDASQTSDMAFSVESSDDVYFVPAFHGLQAPINDNKACVSLMGIKASTTKSHIVRAILESIAFRFMELYETVLEETQVPVMSSIKADGGVCNNDFVMELTSSLTGQSLDKPSQTEMSALGAAFLAGMASGVWKSRDELKAIRCTHALYQPKASIREKYKKTIKEWKEAVRRSRNWYP
ncbi:putative glycerol kinase 5 [Actinia tenebrosa]|uniref:Glycerol kinase 5 n=1 Tax=Actinia tenebrosa TaxID=6105 RepID=A0A6P8HGA0_ACTTE|nr:putative glycerol kinase 5 [Actinia tenebrosa]